MINSTKLSWIVVKDINLAKDFYVNKLGMILVAENNEHSWIEVMPKDKSYRLGIGKESIDYGKRAGINSIMTFNVNDINEAIKYYSEKGIKFIDKVIEIPGHVKMITFIDNDGNTFQLVENIEKKQEANYTCGC